MTASFEYDGFRRRQSRSVGGTTTTFLYDGVNLVQELSSSMPTVNLLAGEGIDETFMRTDDGGTTTFLVDGLRSSLALAGASGTVQTEYTFDPFGATAPSGAMSSNASQFSGRENDGTSLYYYRARYYDPYTGRFLSEDPITTNADMSLYAYAADNPINLVDPLGLQHTPGGPWHPDPWIQFRCLWPDDCATLSWKIAMFKAVIASHLLWDAEHGVTTHTDNLDIPNFQRGLAKCVALHQAKCTNKCPPRKPVPQEAPEPEPIRVPPAPSPATVGAVGTVLLIITGILVLVAG